MATSKRAVGRMGLSGNVRVYSSTKTSASSSASSPKPSKAMKAAATGKVVTTKRRSTGSS